MTNTPSTTVKPPRIVMVSGKGGVGKTTVAAATALALARQGYKTIVMSFDLAHSLADSFSIRQELFSESKGLAVPVEPNLHYQEIDVQEELQRNWGDVYKYMASLMMGGGLDGIVAEEAAILPGMEDIIALLHINKYAREGTYDAVVVDCPPTSESLRFVSIIGSIDWYVRKRLKVDRRIAGVLRPLANRFAADTMMLPDDSYFVGIQSLFERLEGVEKLLQDPAVTTLRLVTVADRMVVRETQRAFMYFNLYGIAVDSVIVNRLLPKGDGYFSHWAENQTQMLQTIRESFEPVPVTTVPFQQTEVVGLERLGELANQMFRQTDPIAQTKVQSPFKFEAISDKEHKLSIHLPFVPKHEIDVSRNNEDLVLRIGTFKRVVLLPRAIAAMSNTGAKMNGDWLDIHFRKGA